MKGWNQATLLISDQLLIEMGIWIVMVDLIFMTYLQQTVSSKRSWKEGITSKPVYRQLNELHVGPHESKRMFPKYWGMHGFSFVNWRSLVHILWNNWHSSIWETPYFASFLDILPSRRASEPVALFESAPSWPSVSIWQGALTDDWEPVDQLRSPSSYYASLFRPEYAKAGERKDESRASLVVTYWERESARGFFQPNQPWQKVKKLSVMPVLPCHVISRLVYDSCQINQLSDGKIWKMNWFSHRHVTE